MKDKIMKIVYFATVFLVVGTLLFNISIPVVAGMTVESLPRTDVEVEITYDSDYLYLNYSGRVFKMPFSYDVRYKDDNGAFINQWLLRYNESASPIYYTGAYAPYTTSCNSSGSLLNFSFWFSESEHRIYIFTHYNSDTLIESYSGGSFVFSSNADDFTCVNYIDLSDMSFNRLGLLGMNDSGTIHGIGCRWNVSSNSLVSGYTNELGIWSEFPQDMLCVYSNYEISGFYELDNSSVFTPAYYFKYQYLFYVEDVGYTFIDSACPINSIVDMRNGYVFVYFDDVCNAHAYISSNGVAWQELTVVNGMYALYQQMNYKYFYDNVGGNFVAKLVYTTDLDYGVEPIIKPEYKDLTDIIESLKNSDLVYEVDDGTPDLDGPMDKTNWLWDIANKLWSDAGMSSNISGYFGVDEFTYSDFMETYVFNSLTSLSMPMYNYDSGEYIGTRVTVLGVLFGIYENTYDNNLLLDNLQLNLHNDLKSVFDNISLTNTYMESIDAAITDLPNYTKQFNESIGVQKDILDALERIEVSSDISLNPDSSGSSGTVTNFDMTVFNNWMSELDSSIDNISGLVAMDEMTDVFDSVVDESGETIGSLSTFLDGVNDETTISQLDDVSNYISAAMVSITKLKVLDAAFNYAGGLSNGIGFINAYADNFYAASGDYAPVFIVGTAMVCVNMFVRRRE